VLGRLFGGCWVSFAGDDKVMIHGVQFIYVLALDVVYTRLVLYVDSVWRCRSVVGNRGPLHADPGGIDKENDL